MGEQVYFTGATETFASGDRLEHGKQGEVVGPAIHEDYKGKGVEVRFPGSKRTISCYLTNVRRCRRAQPHTAPRRTSCPTPLHHTPVAHYTARVGAQVSLSREPPPPLLGGYTVGEQVYYTGSSHTFEDGDRLEHGKQGEVMGPATDESFRGKGVDVRFPGNKDAISCYLTEVRRRCAQPPTAPRRPCCLSSRSPSHTTSAVWAHR